MIPLNKRNFPSFPYLVCLELMLMELLPSRSQCWQHQRSAISEHRTVLFWWILRRNWGKWGEISMPSCGFLVSQNSFIRLSASWTRMGWSWLRLQGVCLPSRRSLCLIEISVLSLVRFMLVIQPLKNYRIYCFGISLLWPLHLLKIKSTSQS